MISLVLRFAFGCAALAAEPYSMKPLIDRAVERNADLAARRLDAGAQRAKAAQVARWDDPALELGGERRDEPQGTTGFGRVGLAQAVPRPGRQQARADAAASLAQLEEVDAEISEVEVRGRVLELIYGYRVASERAAHAKERYDRFRTVSTYLRSRPFAAPQKRAEAIIVRSKVSVLLKELRELDARKRMAWSALNLYIGLPQETEIAAPWYEKAPAFALDDLRQKASAANPEIRRQRGRVQAQETDLRLARFESWPGLTVSAAYSQGNGASPETNYGLGVSLPIPLLNANRDGIRAAEARRSAEDARLKWAQEKLGAGLESAFERYGAAANSLADLPPSSVHRQEREMMEIDASFKRGQVDLVTFLEADFQHFDALGATLSVQTEFLSALRELLLLAGRAPQPLEPTAKEI